MIDSEQAREPYREGGKKPAISPKGSSRCWTYEFPAGACLLRTNLFYALVDGDPQGRPC